MKRRTEPPTPMLTNEALAGRLAERGLRFTTQRGHVYRVLLQERDHPTAEQVFMRSKHSMPDISMATVYNCLDALVRCRLVKEVNLDRSASRYCPNMREHCHFYCASCEDVYDIELPAGPDEPPVALPRGFQPLGFDLAVRGLCPRCGDSSPKPRS